MLRALLRTAVLGLALMAGAPTLAQTPAVEVKFSPSRAAEQAIVNFIGEARKSVHVAAYSFTSKEIAQALLGAKRRGIDVRVVVDKSQRGERYTAVNFLANQGVPVRINSRYAIQHSKYIIVDGASVQTGSFNFTASARDRNSENVLILRAMPAIASQYEANWAGLWNESQDLAPAY